MGRRTPPPVLLALVVALGVVIVALLLLPLFAGPASRQAPRDLPVAVAGPAPAAQAFAAMLEAAQPGAFKVTTVDSAAAADEAIKDRSVYAALILGDRGLAGLHTASAASPVVAATLAGLVAQLSQGQPVPVVDVVPLNATDPRGGGFAAGFFPLVLTAMLAAIVLYFVVPTIGARVVGLLVFAALAGVAGAAVLHSWLGVISGNWLAVAGVISLIVLAVSATVHGLATAIGPAGIAVGAVLVLLIGNALAGIAAAPELLPQPWGQVGQWLPMGAGGTLLRSTSWFNGAGATQSAWVLVAWAVAGLLLVGYGALRGRRPATSTGS